MENPYYREDELEMQAAAWADCLLGMVDQAERMMVDEFGPEIKETEQYGKWVDLTTKMLDDAAGRGRENES